MISIVSLRGLLENDRVAFDKWGRPVDIDAPVVIAPATMLVVEVTDALKEVDATGRVIGSVDRAGVWAVRAMVLHRSVLELIEGDEISAEDLIATVEATGVAWQVTPIFDP